MSAPIRPIRLIRLIRLTTLTCLTLAAAPAAAQQRIADLTTREGEVPVRLVGYGLVVGLDGSGDRSFGGRIGAVHTVRSVTNLLRRFNIEVPAEHLRLRNVAAVLVTAEVSPWLRPGGRFEVQVASLGDATSLRGGMLWMAPLVMNPDDAPFATAQGPLAVSTEERTGRYGSTRGASSGRISDGGVLELPLPPVVGASASRLMLRNPDLGMATRIAAAINAAHGDSAARVEDPGLVALKPPAPFADTPLGFLAAVDTLPVAASSPARIVVDARNGVVVAGGEVRIGPAVVSLRGITVRIGVTADSTAAEGLVSLGSGATVRDVASGLHAMGAAPSEVAAVFDALRSAGALAAAVVVR